MRLRLIYVFLYLAAVLCLASGRVTAAWTASKPVAAADATKPLPAGAIARLTMGHSGPPGAVRALAFSPDSAVLATGTYDDTIVLWRVVPGEKISVLHGHGSGGLAFAPRGDVLASVSVHESTVRLWRVSTGKELRRLTIRQGPRPGTGLYGVSFSRDGDKLGVACMDATARIIKPDTGKEVFRLENPPFSVCCVAFSPIGSLLATGSHHGELRLWDSERGKQVRLLSSHAGASCGVAFSPDGRILAEGSFESAVFLWETVSGRNVAALKGHTGPVRAVAFSPNGHALVSVGDDMTVHLWEVYSGRERRALRGHHGPMTCAAFSVDGKQIASGSEDGTVLLWRVIEQRRDRGLPDLDKCWALLMNRNASQAYEAMSFLIAVPDRTLQFLKSRLEKAPEIDSAEISRFIADLNSDDFSVREKAEVALEQLGEHAERSLREALLHESSPEARRRINHLLEDLTGPVAPGVLRLLRTVETLERIGNPNARELLHRISETPWVGKRVRDEAEGSLRRLEGR
jgi:hypothetical protein